MNRGTLLRACGSLAIVLAGVSCHDATAPVVPGAVQAPDARLGALGAGPFGSVIYTCQKGGDFELCTMNADGSGQKQITDRLGVSNFSGDLDGHRIVFSKGRQNAPRIRSSLYRMRLDGSGVKRLTFNDGFDFEATWSPDGKQIVFTRITPDLSGDADLAIINADGSELHDLVSRFASDAQPAWSPDGKEIAFGSGFGSANGLFDIHIIRPDGTGERNLTHTQDVDENHPSWSPNGRQLAYDGNGDIYVSDAQGSGKRQLTTDPAFEFETAWSRSGKLIYYAKDMGQGIFDIFAMNADGSRQRNLTNTPDVSERFIHVR